MIMKKAAALCRARKYACIMSSRGENGELLNQYMGDGSAFYELPEALTLTIGSLAAILDISEEERKKWNLTDIPVPEGLDFGWITAKDVRIMPYPLHLLNGSYELIPLITTDGICFIDAGYLAPLKDARELEFYERRKPDGDLYIVAASGMIFCAAIMPVIDDGDYIKQKVYELGTACRKSIKGDAENG